MLDGIESDAIDGNLGPDPFAPVLYIGLDLWMGVIKVGKLDLSELLHTLNPRN